MAAVLVNPDLIQPVAHRPDVDPKLLALWRKFGLPEEILDTHLDCAIFLKQSRLIYSIVGYKNSWNERLPVELQEGIKLSLLDNHPLIYFQGVWTRWEVIRDTVEYDTDEVAIVSKRDRSETWNYIYPDGLQIVPKDHLVPIYQLTDTQLAELRQSSGCRDDQLAMLQVFTGRYDEGIPDHPLFTNLKRQIPCHVATRYIAPSGLVSSVGYGLALSKVQKHSQIGLALGTSNTTLGSVDAAEFRSFSRRLVTTIPLDQEKSVHLRQRWAALFQKTLRFNFASQNCASFAVENLEMTGVEHNFATTIPEILYSVLPDLKHIPLVGGALNSIQSIVNAIFQYVPGPVRTLGSWVFQVIIYIPQKVSAITITVLSLLFGSSVEIDERKEAQDDGPKIITTKRLVDSWGDLFDDKTARFHYSAKVSEWQERQPGTVIHEYEGPKLYVAPPSAG